MKRRRLPRRFVGTPCVTPGWCVDCRANTTPCTVMRRWGVGHRWGEPAPCPRHHGWELYMVAHALWAAADGPARGYLCVGCLERRLGRELTAADFMDVPLNEPLDCDSARLADRKHRTERAG